MNARIGKTSANGQYPKIDLKLATKSTTKLTVLICTH